jgi:hypothetical protein
VGYLRGDLQGAPAAAPAAAGTSGADTTAAASAAASAAADPATGRLNRSGSATTAPEERGDHAGIVARMVSYGSTKTRVPICTRS